MSRIAEKLAQAAKACGYVQRDASNAFHKYRYASAANILGHVNDALHEAGLAVVDTLPEIVSTEGVGKDRVVTARMTVIVADTEGDERATFRGLGSGMDSGDKAVMKACTAALKYAWLGAFSISTGDDPEADETTDLRTAGAKGDAKGGAKPKGREGHAAGGANQSTRKVDENVDPLPAETPAALESFNASLGGIELPGEAVAVWIKHRNALSTLSATDREGAWRALCKRTEEVGKMTNAKVWLKKAIAESDATRGSSGASEEGSLS